MLKLDEQGSGMRHIQDHKDKRAMKEGATAFLTKPVQEDSFIAAVAQIIGPGTAALRAHQHEAAQAAGASN